MILTKMIATIVASAIFIIISLATHRCGLSCAVLEHILLVTCAVLFPVYLFFAKSADSIRKRFCLLIVLCIFLKLAYGTFLHSPYFPYAWLDENGQKWVELTRQEEDVSK